MKTNKKKQRNFYYSFLTIFLLFFAIYFSFIAIYNTTKIIIYNKKLIKIENSFKEANEIQSRLKAEIESFQSPEAYEAFLRNHLKYAAPDEILVIIVPAKKN